MKLAIASTLAGTLALASAANADVIKVTYEAAGVQTPPAALFANATAAGTETFDGATPQNTIPLFKTRYGTGGTITGVYSPTFNISTADLYSGAGGTGLYIGAPGSGSGYTISFNGPLGGINYFGLWIGALDLGNTLAFKRAGTTVGTFSGATAIAALGACPFTGTNPYCDNPNAAFTGQNRGQQYAFVNFLDTNGLFDQIVVTDTRSDANFESDNHTVGYCADVTTCLVAPTVPSTVPEPASLALLFGATITLGLVRRRTSHHDRTARP